MLSTHSNITELLVDREMLVLARNPLPSPFSEDLALGHTHLGRSLSMNASLAIIQALRVFRLPGAKQSKRGVCR